MLTCTKCGSQFPRRDSGSGRQREVCDDCRKPVTYDHVCTVCGDPFTSTKKNQKMCSPECYKVYDKDKTYSWRERNPERYKELCQKHSKTYHDKKKKENEVVLQCEICENDFVKRSRLHKTCSPECSDELRRRRQRK